VVNFLKIRVFTLLLLTLFFRVSFAQSNCPPEFVAPEPDQYKTLKQNSKDRGFLWKVTKAGKTSHLYGTIHVSKADWIIPGSKVLDALRQSDKIAVELNFLDPDVLKSINKLSTAIDSPKLSNKLNERVKQYAVLNCIKFESLLNLRPEMQLISMQMLLLRSEKIYPELGIDMLLMGFANAGKKTIIGVETPEEQINAIISKPEELEQDMSDALARLEAGRDKEMLVKLTNAWAEKDFYFLSKYEEWCDCLNTQKERDEMKRLGEDRNIVIADRFNKIHSKEGKVFLAVGTLHMVGTTGIPALLKKQGYLVERIH
jgi:uncharacterized protein